MLTARGWWFLVAVALLLLAGVVAAPSWTVMPALLGLALLAWFAFEWAAFQVRANAAVRRLTAAREVLQGGRPVPMVWAGLPFEVRVSVRHDGPTRIPFAVLEDRPPQAAERPADGANELSTFLNPNAPAEITYALRCPTPGVLRFEGVTVRAADPQGFFYLRTFLPDGGEYLVLPPLADDEGRQRADKRFNTLPPPGVHRFRRPGTGNELLDLRDYQPGDPPKMIAWKPSARRDRLITKEYESDVPVRCHVFVDTSEGVRLGPPGGTPLARLVGIAAAVAQAATANRDLVGLTTFGTERANTLAPARSKPHVIAVLRRLAEAAALQPGADGADPAALTARAFPLARDLYPELTAAPLNTMPFARLWRAALDRSWGWLLPLLVILPSFLILAFYFRLGWVVSRWFGAILTGAKVLTDSLGPRFVKFGPVSVPAILLYALFLFVLPTLIGLGVWFVHGARGWLNPRRGELTRRKRLAALFALQDGGGPGTIERYVHDDDEYRRRVGAFLQLHQTRVPVPLYDDAGEYRYRGPEKAAILAGAVVRAVSRARDNELYVMLADLAELGPDVEPLVKAVRVARARKHQVLVLIPWPAGMSTPEGVQNPGSIPHAARREAPDPRPARAKPRRTPPPGAERLKLQLPAVRDGLVRQYHDGYRRLRRALGEAGATVVRINDGDPVRLVLDRLERLRGVRTRR